MFEISSICRLAGERHRELLLGANGRRLVRQARPRGLEAQRFYNRGLAWLGRRMVVWGWRLQGRYGAMSTH